MSDEAATWVGRRAVAWVIDDAPVPADLAFTLTVIARRCDERGRGSYQSQRTIAEKTGKSVDQVARDIRRLRALGLLLLGDQSLPGRHGIPAGQCPTVYDLPIGMKGPKPSKESKNRTGQKATPRMDAPPASERDPLHGSPPTPCMDAGPASRIHAGPSPCMDAPQTDPFNNPKNKTSISRSAQEREAHRWINKRYCGLTDQMSASVIEEVRDRAPRTIESLVAYLSGMAEGDLADIISAVMDAERPPPELTVLDGRPPGTDRATPTQHPILRALPESAEPPRLVLDNLRAELCDVRARHRRRIAP